MPTEVVLAEPREIVITSDQTELIKRTICQGATDSEMQLFFFDCQRRGTHPLDRLIHFTKRGNKYTPITSIDFFRLRAHASHAFAGEEEPVYTLGTDGLPDTCKYTVYRLVQGQRFPWTGTARWAEYYPGEQMGFNWRKMPNLMLAKCAEALALRKAFPSELQGLYVKEEMDQAGPEHKPARKPSDILRESEQAEHGQGDGLENSGEAVSAASPSVRVPASQDAPALSTDNYGRPQPTLAAAYLETIGNSETVTECSKAINAGLADPSLSVFEGKQIQEAGKARILELRGKVKK